jgi:hypothetical protein
VAFKNPLLGMLNFVQVWFAAFLFCGLMVPLSDVIWPLKVFGYILPLKYGIRVLLYEEFIDQNWRGASRCNPNADPNCFKIAGFDGAKEGYTCGDITSGDLCFGAEGWQVLTQLQKSFSFIQTEDNTLVDGSVILLITFVLKVGHAYFATSRCYTYMKLHKQ